VDSGRRGEKACPDKKKKRRAQPLFPLEALKEGLNPSGGRGRIFLLSITWTRKEKHGHSHRFERERTYPFISVV